MLKRLLQIEDVRRELASRWGNEIHHREEVARLQKTIEALREVLTAKSVRAAAETNRRDSCLEELQKGPFRPDAGTRITPAKATPGSARRNPPVDSGPKQEIGRRK